MTVQTTATTTAPTTAATTVQTPGPTTGPTTGPNPGSDVPALLDLTAAGLVSHELIGDPGLLAAMGEPAALRALCDLVAGPVYRMQPFHYAFRAGPGDVGGRLGALPPAAWTGALAAAADAALGPGAAWIGAVEPGEAAGAAPGAGVLPDLPLLLLRARDAGVAAGLAAAPEPGLQAVIDASHAVECARAAAAAVVTAAADPAGPLAARLAALEARIEASIGARIGALDALGATLAQVLQRLDVQADVLHGHIAREERAAEALAALEARLPAFEERLGLAVAELVARLEPEAVPEAPVPRGLAAAPQVS